VKNNDLTESDKAALFAPKLPERALKFAYRGVIPWNSERMAHEFEINLNRADQNVKVTPAESFRLLRSIYGNDLAACHYTRMGAANLFFKSAVEDLVELGLFDNRWPREHVALITSLARLPMSYRHYHDLPIRFFDFEQVKWCSLAQMWFENDGIHRLPGFTITQIAQRGALPWRSEDLRYYMSECREFIGINDNIEMKDVVDWVQPQIEQRYGDALAKIHLLRLIECFQIVYSSEELRSAGAEVCNVLATLPKLQNKAGHFVFPRYQILWSVRARQKYPEAFLPGEDE
jgi:hypothetical protein